MTLFPLDVRDIMLNIFKDNALELAKQGTPIFPLAPNGKRPMAKTNGVKDATTDIDIIKGWIKSYPNANIGMPTGKLSGITVIDLDIDIGKQKDGIKEWETLCKENNYPPYCAKTVITPSGGRHLYFEYNELVKTGVDNIANGIDVRNDGGYVVIPPSIVNGKLYTEVSNVN